MVALRTKVRHLLLRVGQFVVNIFFGQPLLGIRSQQFVELGLETLRKGSCGGDDGAWRILVRGDSDAMIVRIIKRAKGEL